MSHFTVLVVGDDVDAALAPFDEGDRSKLTPKSADEMAVLRTAFEKDSKDHASFDEYLREWEGLELRDGQWGSTYNQNSKWDWYTIGGRWSNRLVTKAGLTCDSTTIGDLSLEGVRAANRARAELWWAEAMEQSEDCRGIFFNITTRTARTRTKEAYLKEHEPFNTFAVLKDGNWYERGEMGGWASVSNEKDGEVWQAEFDKLLADLPPDTKITVVDCHI